MAIDQKQLDDIFNGYFDNSEKVSSLYGKMRDGKASLDDANAFAIELGEICCKAFDEAFGDEEMFTSKELQEMAGNMMFHRLKQNYGIIAKYASRILDEINASNHIGIKTVDVTPDEKKLKETTNQVKNATSYADVKDKLAGGIVSNHLNAVDDVVYDNAKFQYDSGNRVFVTRKYEGPHESHPNGRAKGYMIDCEWCKELSGTWEWGKDIDSAHSSQMFARHSGCRCEVTFEYKLSKKRR